MAKQPVDIVIQFADDPAVIKDSEEDLSPAYLSPKPKRSMSPALSGCKNEIDFKLPKLDDDDEASVHPKLSPSLNRDRKVVLKVPTADDLNSIKQMQTNENGSCKTTSCLKSSPVNTKPPRSPRFDPVRRRAESLTERPGRQRRSNYLFPSYNPGSFRRMSDCTESSSELELGNSDLIEKTTNSQPVDSKERWSALFNEHFDFHDDGEVSISDILVSN